MWLDVQQAQHLTHRHTCEGVDHHQLGDSPHGQQQETGVTKERQQLARLQLAREHLLSTQSHHGGGQQGGGGLRENRQGRLGGSGFNAHLLNALGLGPVALVEGVLAANSAQDPQADDGVRGHVGELTVFFTDSADTFFD